MHPWPIMNEIVECGLVNRVSSREAPCSSHGDFTRPNSIPMIDVSVTTRYYGVIVKVIVMVSREAKVTRQRAWLFEKASV